MEPPVSNRKPGSRAVPIVAPPPAQSPSIKKEDMKDAKIEAPKEDVQREVIVVDAVGAGGAIPKISINPVIVIHEESCTSEEDEGHFSDTPLESEKSR